MESPKAYNKKTPVHGLVTCGGPSANEQGFTLIELSIVLVIIGLIVGGILVGQDLIKAAEIRATVGQVEKYNSAVNTFRTKYNAIPGDITQVQAAAFGLFAESTLAGTAGHEDGNGLVEGGSGGGLIGLGETIEFWRHLSDANMIDGQFGANTTDSLIVATSGAVTANVTVPAHSLPPTKTTPNNSFTVFAAGGLNYFEIVPVSQLSTAGAYTFNTVGLTPVQSYNMDIKLDDGLPETGIVTAKGIAGINTVPTNATTSTSLTCTIGTGGPGATTAADTYNRVPTSGGSDGSCGVRFRFN